MDTVTRTIRLKIPVIAITRLNNSQTSDILNEISCWLAKLQKIPPLWTLGDAFCSVSYWRAGLSLEKLTLTWLLAFYGDRRTILPTQ